MNTAMGACNPTIWKFLDVLIKEQGLTDIKLNQAQGGHQAPKQRHAYQDTSRRLAVVVHDFVNRPIIDYLRGFAYNFHL